MAISVVTFAQTTWNIDPSHSNVNFSVSHLVISEVDGKFKKFDENLSTTSADFSKSAFNFEIDTNSINTENEQRDSHLKSEDLFYTEKFPKMTFKSTSFKKKSGNQNVLKREIVLAWSNQKHHTKCKIWRTAKDGYGNTKDSFIIT